MDRILILLFVGMLWFTGMVFVCEVWFKDDGQVFTLIGGLLTAFSASFFTRIQGKPPSVVPTVPPNATLDSTTTVHQKAAEPEVKKEP